MKAHVAALAMILIAEPALSDSSGITVVLDDYSGDPPDSMRTIWNTLLYENIDYGWVGSWRLETAVVHAPQGTIEWPTAGHVLTISPDGSYRLDYKPAHFRTSIAVDGVDMPTAPPPSSLPAGAPGGCLGNGQITGLVVGRLFAPFDVDLDYQDPDGGYPIGAPWMEATIDQGASVKPALHCDGVNVAVTVTNALLAPGMGRPVSSANGIVVPYDYEIDTNHTTMTITSRGVPGMDYVFRWID